MIADIKKRATSIAKGLIIADLDGNEFAIEQEII